jgi:GDP-L-fucose synthase
MQLNNKIYVAGHNGMVGSAIVRKLSKEGYDNIVTRTSKELDLRNQADVDQFFAEEKPDYVFLAAAKVGGILANNTFRAEFLYDNLMIEANVIHAAHKSGVKKLLFLGSSCIYPKEAPTGPLEPTNEPYAIAKITGIKLCDAYRVQYGDHFISAMPTNLYGPNDNYDLQNSHVLPALMRKFIEEVTIWGTGTPRREFLHVDDLAEASYFLMQNYDEPGFINVGTGEDISIGELAESIRSVTGYSGNIVYDKTKPDGMARKLMDVSRIHALGWKATIDLDEGLRRTYQEVKDKVW